jgi:hypothetical protein
LSKGGLRVFTLNPIRPLEVAILTQRQPPPN